MTYICDFDLLLCPKLAAIVRVWLMTCMLTLAMLFVVAGTIVGDVEGYIFNKAEILQMLVSNALVQCAPTVCTVVRAKIRVRADVSLLVPMCDVQQPSQRMWLYRPRSHAS